MSSVSVLAQMALTKDSRVVGTGNLGWTAMDIVRCLLPDCDQCDWMWHIVLLCAKTFFFWLLNRL